MYVCMYVRIYIHPPFLPPATFVNSFFVGDDFFVEKCLWGGQGGPEKAGVTPDDKRCL
jgi:hypothetical protein